MIAVAIQLWPRQTMGRNDAWAVAIVVKWSAIGQNGWIEAALWLLSPPNAFAEGDLVPGRA